MVVSMVVLVMLVVVIIVCLNFLFVCLFACATIPQYRHRPHFVVDHLLNFDDAASEDRTHRLRFVQYL